jgi:hypothetical protein
MMNNIGASAMRLEKSECMDINNLHKILGHCGEARARLTGKALGYEVTGKALGYEVTGKFENCESCAMVRLNRKL